MRHRKKGRKLKRTASHRKALLAAISTSLLRHKKIRTTFAKAKETQRVVERLITKAKRALARESNGQSKNVHARREVAQLVKDRNVVKTLFEEIAPKVFNRPGGYTRVVKLGQRYGDGAQVAVLELVDFNVAEAATSAPKEAKAKKEKKTSEAKESKEMKGKAAAEPKTTEAEQTTRKEPSKKASKKKK